MLFKNEYQIVINVMLMFKNLSNIRLQTKNRGV